MEKNMKKYFPVFVLPTFISFTVVFLIPFILGIYLSFTEFTTVESASWVGLDNYIKAFTQDENFKNSLWFTIKFTIVSIITINIISFFLALLLTRALKGTNFFRTVFFMPNLIGGIVLGYIWNLLINAILGVFGFDITYDADFGFWGLVFLLNWQLIGYMMIIYIAGLQNIPEHIHEAAAIDGAGRLRRVWHITMPALVPVIVVQLIMTLGSIMNLGYEKIILLYNENTYETADVISTYVYRYGLEGGKYGMGAAIGLFNSLVNILILTGSNWLSRRMTEESLW